MKIKITGKELKITEALNDYVEKKLDRINKYFEDAEADVTLRTEKNEQIAEICVIANGEKFRAVVEDKDFTALLTLNGLTNVTVSKQDSILDVKLDITNEQYLYVKRKKVYKRKYKNGW